MLILPPGHAKDVSSGRRLAGRERLIVSAIGALAAVLAVVAVFALTRGAGTPAKGCLSVTVPSSLGGQVLAGCGATAREMCSQLGTPAGFTGTAERLLAPQCRKQGLKVG